MLPQGFTMETPTNPNSWFAKSGMLSAFGSFEGKKVKLYEAFNPKQVQLRKFVDDSPISHYFPKLITYNDKYIVEEFIDGKRYDGRDLTDQILHFIEDLKQLEYPECTYDYIEYIHKRANLEYTPLDLPNYVNHNDITKDNILMVKGGFKIIDNEFLACNNGWILNYKNCNLLTDTKQDDLVERMWKVRKAWKR